MTRLTFATLPAGLIALSFLLAAGPALSQPAVPGPLSASADARGPANAVPADRMMIAAADPAAARAGLDILRRGGSAVDAAITATLVLNLVEPQSAGIGGGGFLVRYDAATRGILTYDGRESAPAAAGPGLFLRADGTPMDFRAAVVGGRSVGTPGLLRMLAMAHEAHGNLPWADLFAPAIVLARDGFTVSPRLAELLRGHAARDLRTDPAARDYFFPGGEPLAAGAQRANPAFADTLERIAREGPDAFYIGPIARDIVAAVRGFADNPGLLDEADLASYVAKPRPPVCQPYRTWRVCGMGPPSSGGLTVGQILGILAAVDLPARGPGDPVAWHLLAEASKLAFADRNRYMADDDFVDVPRTGLLDAAYLARRAATISDRAAPVPVLPGDPPGAGAPASDGGDGRPGTTHLSVVDAEGNAVSLTASIEGPFGAQLMVRGFMLNNELTDFSFEPLRDGDPVANRVEGGKRPRSSMAPTIVTDAAGGLRLVIGSPGGSRIIGYVAQTVLAVLDWGLDVQQAIDMARIVNRNGATEIEDGPGTARLAVALDGLGHAVEIREAMTSGIHAIEVTPAGWRGGADPRREGVALGE